jgi:uncharacterized protein with von Willebrand factor type A (vWA) domain
MRSFLPWVAPLARRCSGLLLAAFLVGAPCLLQGEVAPGRPAPASVAAGDDLAELGMKVSVTIIFDTSGSMADRNKLVMAKRAFNWWLDSAPVSMISQWSLYVFEPGSAKPKLVLDRKSVGVDVLKRSIGSLEAAGGTPLARTIEAVTRVIDAENTKAAEGKGDILRQVVLIFTDGRDSTEKDPVVQKRVQKLRDVGSEVFSIGYQGEGEYLAKTSDKFIMAGDEKQLKEGLSSFSYFIEKSSGASK